MDRLLTVGAPQPDCVKFFIHGLFTFELTAVADALAYAQRVGGEANRIRYGRLMTVHRNPNAETAVQYLVWALECIEKTGNHKAAHHVGIAVDALRKGTHRSANKTDGQAISPISTRLTES